MKVKMGIKPEQTGFLWLRRVHVVKVLLTPTPEEWKDIRKKGLHKLAPFEDFLKGEYRYEHSTLIHAQQSAAAIKKNIIQELADILNNDIPNEEEYEI